MNEPLAYHYSRRQAFAFRFFLLLLVLLQLIMVAILSPLWGVLYGSAASASRWTFMGGASGEQVIYTLSGKVLSWEKRGMQWRGHPPPRFSSESHPTLSCVPLAKCTPTQAVRGLPSAI